jgi:DNA-binding transcriptional MocR family regulator
MIETVREEFPSAAEVEIPCGGLFAWVKLPKSVDTKEVLVKAIENKVAFVPGGSFFPNGGQENFMRLNFSNMSEEKIVEGIKRLGKILKEIL